MRATDDDRDLYVALTKGFEDEGGYQTDRRGNQTLTYITGEQCVSRLNQTFGPLGWTFEIRERWFDAEADECCVLGRLTVYRKVALMETLADADGTVSYPIREILQPIFREQVGSQKHNRRRISILTPEAFDRLEERPGAPSKYALYTKLDDGNWRKNDSDEILDAGFDWKGAGTDSLKKCASLIGIALELSRKGGGVQRPQNRPSAASQGRQAPQRPQGQPTPIRPPQGQQEPEEKRFEPPFKSQKVSEELACRAFGCGVVLVPGETYEIEINGKREAQTTEYITKRSREEAFGAVFCLKHAVEWITAKRKQGIPLANDPTKAATA